VFALVLCALTATAFAQDATKIGEKRQKLRKQALTLTQPVQTSNGQVLAPGTYDLEITNDSKRRMVLVFLQDGKPVGETLAKFHGFAPGMKVSILCDGVVPAGAKAGILCDDHDHGAILCNEKPVSFQCNARNAKIQCDDRNAKFQCDDRNAKFQCDDRNAKIQCDERNAKLQCDDRNAKIQCNGRDAKIQCDAHNAKIQCNLRNANIASIQCNLKPAGDMVAFKQLGFGAKSPVLFDAAKGTLSILSASGDYAGRGSIEATLVPVQ
jgi:hypothetical protein